MINSTNSNNGTLVFQGQTVLGDDMGANEPVTLRRVLDDGSQFVRQNTADGDGQVTFDTEGLSADDYYMVSEDGSQRWDFEVAVQSLDASFDDDSVKQSETTLDIESNRGGTFHVNVSASGLDSDELTDIFGTSSDADVVTVSEDDDNITLETNDGESIDADFSDIDADEYNFSVDVIDTAAYDEASISVTDAGETSVSVSPQTISQNQGDVAEITLDLTASDKATLVIGGDEANFQSNITVTDDDDDGTVTVYYNTYAAGHLSSAEFNQSDIAWVDSDSDDELNNYNESKTLDNILDTGDYDIAASAGHEDPSTVLDEPDGVGTLFLTERSTNSHAVWTVPSDQWSDISSDDLDSLDDLNLTQDSTIAYDDDTSNGDVVVHQIGVTGIFGSYEAAGSIADMNNVTITLEQTDESTGPNADPKTINISNSNAKVIADADNDTLYVAFDSDNFDVESGSLEVDDAYNATFSVHEDSWLNSDEDDPQNVSAEFSIDEAETTFDADPIEVTATENAMISGTSTAAPGSDVTIRVRSDSSENPFIKTVDTTVTSNGTFSGTFDFSGISVDTEFTANARGPLSTTDEVDGSVVEAQMTSTTTSTTSTTSTTTSTTSTTTSTTSTTTSTTSTTSGGTPGFGAGVALVALAGAALLALRRDN
ncbi:BGTF surface domain-containing protein [Halarchaeum sp. CBA1220]|uniref:DUF7827 domain-containing protein n=1 Tax=Halarchaeum sp. CBA1220 TaxID=1853682 RepID=UPI002102B5B3|nr:BGTF surface domain-containing protein [Halarchaeum sp. CBA1220]